MNVRKPIDYSAMFAALDTLMAAELPQMKLYCEIGRLVSGRPEKAPLLQRRSTYAVCTPTPPASLPEICAGCGSFSGHTKVPQRCWTRP